MKKLLLLFLIILLLSSLTLISCSDDNRFTVTSSDVTTVNNVTYNITYELNGGTNNENNPATYKEGSFLELAVPTKENYLFAGWYIDSEFTNLVTQITKYTSGNIKVYAKWIELNGNITLQLDNGSYKVVGCNEELEYLYIPSMYNGLPVTSIGKFAFKNHGDLRYVYVPDSVTAINHSAFEKCEYLSEIRLSNNLISIDSSAFFRSGITSITIPDKTTVLGSSVFSECEFLESVILPKSLNIIPLNTFYGCKSLKSITVDDENANYKSVDGVLYTKDGKTLVLYPAARAQSNYQILMGTENIDKYAFMNSSNLKGVTIPDTVKFIGSYAFGNTSIESVIIPDSVATMESYVFYGCKSLKNVVLSRGLEEIGANAFKECAALEGIIIPDNIKIIRANAFYGCNSLKSIVIPNSVAHMGDRVFNNPDIIIYCEAKSKPSYWSVVWCDRECYVVWSYKA